MFICLGLVIISSKRHEINLDKLLKPISDVVPYEGIDSLPSGHSHEPLASIAPT